MSQHFQFDAYQAYSDLRRRYVDFLTDIVGIRGGPLPGLLDRFWNTDNSEPCLFAPLLVQGAFPFSEGQYLRELKGGTGEGGRLLNPKTVQLLEQAGITYKLFAHQVDAVRQAADGRTVVVAAGTGSGKTESFLIPIIDRLISDAEKGLDDLSQPGVRALVIYPLNALVNNQVDRLLGLLGAQADITFAYYTSRLKEKRSVAEAYYSSRGQPVPPACQIIDRQSLRGLDSRAPRRGPPHILVTNFSMLEYMLIRPLDRTIFQPSNTQFNGKPRLKTIVLDEAHVYAGAQAAEMHMLLRRTADRFGARLEDIQGFATSATLSRGDDASGTAALKDYACRMFSKEAARVAVVEGKTYLPPIQARARSVSVLKVVGGPPVSVPDEIRTLDGGGAGKKAGLVTDAETARIAAKAAVALGIANEADVAALAAEDRGVPARVLHRLCASHPSLATLRRKLFEAKRTPTLDEAADLLYGPAEPSEERRRATDSVLRLASLGRLGADDLPFIPVRMHAFVRAPLGVWVDPRPPTDRTEPSWPWGRLHLLPDDTLEVPRLQLLVCLACGKPYLEAALHNDAYAAPSGNVPTVALTAHSQGSKMLPESWGGQRVHEVAVIDQDRHGNKVVDCAHCQTPRAKLRTLRLSPRLALGAILDSVYPHLGEMLQEPGKTLPGGGRRLITFSDSRREAARVAAQVERTHDIGLNRQMLWLRIRDLGHCRGAELIRDVARSPLIGQRAAGEALFEVDAVDDLATLSVYEEFSRPPAGARARGQVTLEILGLVEVQYPDLPPRPPQLAALSDAEWAAFAATVLDLGRSSGICATPSFTSEQAKNQDLEELLPFQGKSLVLSAPDPGDLDDEEGPVQSDKDKPVSLIPRNETNRGRLWAYAQRVASRVGISAEELMTALWRGLRAKLDTNCRWLRKGPVADSIQLKLEHLEFVAHSRPPLLSPDTGALFFRAVRGVLPEPGSTADARPPTDEEVQAWSDRHSVRRVTSDEPLGLWSVEHTAQLHVDSLEKQEGEFRTGARNLLASSTTMEMGVDIGGLTLVCLTNVPPGPANYWQRAGRAGRRADGTSMTLTLALATSHDQLVFADPREFLFSSVTPPRVRLDADPLLMRHVNGYLLARFFEDAVALGAQGNPMKAFGTVGSFFVEQSAGAVLPPVAERLSLAPADPMWVAFSRWLSSLDTDGALADRVRRLCKGTVLSADSLPQLAARTSSGLDDAVERVQRDLAVLTEQREQEMAKGEGARDEQFLRALDYQRAAIVDETLIAYFASNGFLPRFGFPLDVVRLNTRWKRLAPGSGPVRSSDEGLPEMRMERALDLALAEYAPGSEVIAGKRVFTSAGLERNWLSDEEAVERHFFYECENCHHLEDGKVEHAACPVCSHPTMSEQAFIELKRDEKSQRRGRRRRGEEEDVIDPSFLRPSVVRQYLRPTGFAVKLGKRPRRVTGDIERAGPALSGIVLSQAQDQRELVPGVLSMSYCPGSRLFTHAEGRIESPNQRGFGFVICRACGLAVPEESWGGTAPAAFRGHSVLRGERKCLGSDRMWRNRVLGTTTPVDALRVELGGDLAPRLVDSEARDAFYATFAAVLQLVAARCLQVDLRTLASSVVTRKTVDGFAFDAVVYESATSGLLRHLADKPATVVEELIRLLKSGRLADFVRFDTQFLGRKLRPDLVRDHFLSEKVLALLKLRENPGVRELRGRGPVLAAIELLDDPGQLVGLVANQLTTEAFEPHALMPHVRARAVEPRTRNLPPKLLLAATPRAAGGVVEESLAAAQVKRLIEDGVLVRRAAKPDGATVAAFPWHVIARKGNACVAIGGLQSGSSGEVPSPRFGARWLDRHLPVEALKDEAQKAVEEFEKLWARGEDVKAADLEPKRLEKTSVVVVRQNSRVPADTSPRRLLDRALADFGGLAGCGQVQKLVYIDRYVVRSSAGLFFLRDLLSGLKFVPQAVATIRSHAAENDGRPILPAQQLLGKSRPWNLNAQNSESVQKWVTSGVAGSVAVKFEIADGLPHARKLLIEFAFGGQVKSLKVCLDQGLDWVRSEAIRGPWTTGPFVANETQVVVSVDQPVTSELGWT